MRFLTKWLVVLLALSEGGWMLFDGVRALVVGDYVRPSSGEYAGQLGPWAELVAGVGVDPESTAMKVVFVAYGVTWLWILFRFVRERPGAWLAMLLVAAASSWYLLVGTLHSVLIVVLLLLPPLRRGRRAAEGA